MSAPSVHPMKLRSRNRHDEIEEATSSSETASSEEERELRPLTYAVRQHFRRPGVVVHEHVRTLCKRSRETGRAEPSPRRKKRPRPQLQFEPVPE